MIHYLANRLTVFLHKKDVIHQDLPVYQYGLELGISSALGMLLVLMVAALFRDLMSGVIFLCSFLFLRTYTGGYHCSTYFRCNLSMVSIYMVCAFLSLLSSGGAPMVSVGLTIVSLGSVLVIMKYAPMDHSNKRLTDQEKVKYRKVAISITLLFYLSAVGLQYLQIDYYTVIHYVLIVTAMLLLLSKRLETN